MKNVFFRKGRATAPHTGRILTLALALVMLLSTLLACNPADPGNEPEREHVDYVAQTKLEMTSSSRKIEARVKSYIDGDTTHFYVDESADFPEGVVKARFWPSTRPSPRDVLRNGAKRPPPLPKRH